MILIEASLDFLRVGAPSGAASWGETTSEFRDAPLAWWLLAFPGVLLFGTIVSSAAALVVENDILVEPNWSLAPWS